MGLHHKVGEIHGFKIGFYQEGSNYNEGPHVHVLNSNNDEVAKIMLLDERDTFETNDSDWRKYRKEIKDWIVDNKSDICKKYWVEAIKYQMSDQRWKDFFKTLRGCNYHQDVMYEVKKVCPTIEVKLVRSSDIKVKIVSYGEHIQVIADKRSDIKVEVVDNNEDIKVRIYD